MSVDLRLGDCLDVLASLDAESVDAVVTDPPYGISFIGKHWDRFGIEERVGKRDVSHLGRLTGGVDDDGRKVVARSASAFATPAGAAGQYDFTATGNRAFQAWCEDWARGCLRVLKPGGHLVSFGGTRTYHRLAAGVEDAGFQIRDQLAWMFGSGFPKSLDVSKAIDAKFGAEREVVGVNPNGRHGEPLAFGGDNGRPNLVGKDSLLTTPATAAAAAWDGWGTALKPGYEPIVLARKPLAGTVAANVMEHGTGALNIDGCRIETSDELGGGGNTTRVSEGWDRPYRHDPESIERHARLTAQKVALAESMGRWPANVVLDEQAAEMVDAQSGDRRSAGEYVKGNGTQGAKAGSASIPIDGLTSATYSDIGGASRFLEPAVSWSSSFA